MPEHSLKGTEGQVERIKKVTLEVQLCPSGTLIGQQVEQSQQGYAVVINETGRRLRAERIFQNKPPLST